MNEYSILGKTCYHNSIPQLFEIKHEIDACERAWSLIKQDDIVFDIGAQYGTWTLPAAATMKPRQVYAFEPHEPFYDRLIENINCNDFKSKITPVNIGFDKRKRKNVPYSESNVSTMEGIIKDKSINVIKLDDYVTENNIEKVNHIKIDVDGPELNILKGGQNTIKRFIPNIAIEEHNAIVPNISLAIYKYLVFTLRLPYNIESIGILGDDRSTAPSCRHTLYWR